MWLAMVRVVRRVMWNDRRVRKNDMVIGRLALVDVDGDGDGDVIAMK